MLYPFWVLLVGAAGVYVVARYTRNSSTTLIVALLFLASAMSVLLAFTRFTETAHIAVGRGLFLFEVSRQGLLACLYILAISAAALLFYVPSMQQGDLARASSALLLASLCAVGTIFSVDALSFALLLGGVPVPLFALDRLGYNERRSSRLYLLYFLPAVLLILFAVIGGDAALSASAGSISGMAGLLLVLVSAAYLLFYPFGFPATSLIPLDRTAAPIVMSMIPATALFGLVRFLPLSTLLGQTIASLGAISSVAWGIVCYRSKEPASTIRHGYLAQTSAISVMIACALSSEAESVGDWFPVVSNHIVAGFGVLLCASVEGQRRGRYLRWALIFFAFCLLGLPPSPGFFGRLHLFLGSFGDRGLFGYLLRLSFLVNLFLVYCLPKALVASPNDTGSVAKPPWWVSWSIGVLAGALLLSMLFQTHLRAYLSASGL